MVRSFLKSSQASWPKDKISNVLSIHFIPWKWTKNERLRTLSFAKLSLGHAQYDSFLPFLSSGKIERACWKWLQSKLNLELGQRRQLTNNSIIQSKQSNSLHFYHNCSSWKYCLHQIYLIWRPRNHLRYISIWNHCLVQYLDTKVQLLIRAWLQYSKISGKDRIGALSPIINPINTYHVVRL